MFHINKVGLEKLSRYGSTNRILALHYGWGISWTHFRFIFSQSVTHNQPAYKDEKTIWFCSILIRRNLIFSTVEFGMHFLLDSCGAGGGARPDIGNPKTKTKPTKKKKKTERKKKEIQINLTPIHRLFFCFYKTMPNMVTKELIYCFTFSVYLRWLSWKEKLLICRRREEPKKKQPSLPTSFSFWVLIIFIGNNRSLFGFSCWLRYIDIYYYIL